MPRTGHRTKDILTAPTVNQAILDTIGSQDILLDYQQTDQPPDLFKPAPLPTETTVTVGPGLVIQAEGPFDFEYFEDTAEGEKEEFKPKPIETDTEAEAKPGATETETETDLTWSNVSRQKAERETDSQTTPAHQRQSNLPAFPLADQRQTKKSSGFSWLLLAAALLGD
jgi:hypothetical protein